MTKNQQTIIELNEELQELELEFCTNSHGDVDAMFKRKEDIEDQLSQLDLSDQEIDFCLVCELEHEVDHPHFSQGATSFR